MTDQGEVLRLASLEEAPRLFQLILRRITWLEERETTPYTVCY